MAHTPSNALAVLSGALADAHSALGALREDKAALAGAARAIDLCASALRRGNKILACGNGGSLCDAMHFCEELTGRFRADRAPLAAIACIDPGHITCTANDFGYDQVFARWVRALGREGDVLIILSTSGNSPNCLLAADAAREAGIAIVALLGKGGGALRAQADVPIIVPGQTADRIQELHMLLLHAMVEGIERQAQAEDRP